MYQRPPLSPFPPGAFLWAQRWLAPVICLLLAALTLALYWQTRNFDFVNFDDGVYVFHNEIVKGGLTLKGIAWVFAHPSCSLYHPLTMLSLMANYQCSGPDAGGYHLTNAWLHAGSAVILFLALLQMTGALWRSAFVAAVFAVHPLRVESVAWVAERKDVLSVFFFMLALWSYARWARDLKSQVSNLKYYFLTLLFFGLGLLSKPTVVTFPFLLLLLDYWPLERLQDRGQFKKLLLEKAPFLILSIVASVLTVLSAGKEVSAYAHVSLWERLGQAAVSYIVYLWQMFWPAGLSVYYPRPPGGQAFWAAGVCFLVLLLLTVGVLFFGRARRYLVAGWLWYLGTMLPMIGIVQAGGFAHADRFTYLPEIGIAMALTWLISELPMDGWFFGAAMFASIAALFAVSWKQLGYWQDSQALWTHALDCTKGNYTAHYSLAEVFLADGKSDAAARQFEAALADKPDYPEAANNLGGIYLQQGRLDEAAAQFQRALKLDEDNLQAHYNLATLLRQQGKTNEAVTEAEKELKLDPANAHEHYFLAVTLRQLGRLPEAKAQYQEVRRLDPGYADFFFNHGNECLQQGKLDDAATNYLEALEINPDFAAPHVNLGGILNQQGRLDEAISHFRRALEINPALAQAQVNLGNALIRKGETKEAIGHIQRAMELAPEDPAPPGNLAWLLATCPDASLRNGPRAVELARKAIDLVGPENPELLRTLAAASAENGQFSEAVESARRALQLAGEQSNRELSNDLNKELKFYKAGRPFHSPAKKPGQASQP